ncbi:DUF6056 family protein [Carnobacterium gallinarum]|uniref:DUF6056 family protein n=1 Tax=Carnobacterium gallinarum TaxID=2749 RepID=UPI0005552E0F|nr:DUF6056 family protein [Carnobacterium gallinarum]
MSKLKVKPQYFAWLIVFSLVVLYHFRFQMSPGSDDEWFANFHKQASFLTYLNSRFNVWSARIVPDAILFYIFLVPLTVWRILNSFFLVLLCRSIVRLFSPKASILSTLSVMCIIGFVSSSVINEGFFWITGSINYLWPLAMGIYVLVPLADYFYRETDMTFSFQNWIRLFVTFIVSFTNEQVLICVIGVFLATIIALLVKKRTIPLYLYLSVTILIIGFLIMYFSPGNALRMQSEVARWFPNFYELSVLSRLSIGFSWLYGQVIAYMLWILMLISGMTCYLLPSSWLKKTLISSSIFLLAANIFKNVRFFDFERIKLISKESYFNFSFLTNKAFYASAFPYVIWTLFIGLLIYASVKASGKQILVSLCYLAGILSSMLMFLSPTIYASGTRVFNVLGVTLAIIAYILLIKIQERISNKNRVFEVILLAIIPIIQFIL